MLESAGPRIQPTIRQDFGEGSMEGARRQAGFGRQAEEPARPAGGRLKYVLHALVLLGLLTAGLKYVNGDAFWHSVRRFHWDHAPLILVLSTAYVLVKGWRFVRQMRSVTDTRPSVILRAYVAGQACTLLPGGMLARAGLLRQAGVPVEEGAAAVALSSLSDQTVLILCSLISGLWFQAARVPALVLLSLLVGVSLLLGLEATRTWLLGLVERLLEVLGRMGRGRMGRVRLLERWHGFLAAFTHMAAPRMLLASVGNAAFAFLLMALALRVAAHGVGAAVPPATLLLAFTLPTMLGRLSAMPGGVGVTEAGMIGILDTAPGVTLDQAAAATLIFRLGTVLYAALLGGAVYLLSWRRTARRLEAAAAGEPA